MSPSSSSSTQAIHVVFLVDRSGSVAGAPTDWLLQEAIRRLQEQAPEGSSWWVSLLFFNDGLRWASVRPMTLNEVHWSLPPARGTSHLGEALELLAGKLRSPGAWMHPLLLVLLSDGKATDSVARGLDALDRHPRGAEALWVVLSPGAEPSPVTMELLEKRATLPPSEALRSLLSCLQDLLGPPCAA